jgi:hypothetical protein
MNVKRTIGRNKVLPGALLALAAACSWAGQVTPELQRNYRQAAFDLCGAVVEGGSSVIDAVIARNSSIKVDGPAGIEILGSLRERLEKMLRLEPSTKLYRIRLPESSADTFVVGYLKADASACILLSQELPGIREELLKQIEDKSAGWMPYLQNASAQWAVKEGPSGRNLQITTNLRGKETGLEFTLVELHEGDLPTVASAEKREQLITTFLSACLNAIHQGKAPVREDFASILEPKRDGKDGVMNLADGLPRGMLMLGGNKGLTCSLMGVPNVLETQATLAEAHRQLAALGATATNKPTSIPGGKLQILKGTDAPRRGANASIKAEPFLDGAIFSIMVYQIGR